jgi:hypothetical protein
LGEETGIDGTNNGTEDGYNMEKNGIILLSDDPTVSMVKKRIRGLSTTYRKNIFKVESYYLSLPNQLYNWHEGGAG